MKKQLGIVDRLIVKHRRNMKAIKEGLKKYNMTISNKALARRIKKENVKRQ